MTSEASHELTLGSTPALRPRSLLVTIYGLYARPTGGWFSVSALIRLMAELGVEEPAVRSSISRLKRRGILEPERVDGRAGYALSAQARTILDDGDRRIFLRRRGRLDDGWLVVAFSVPESERGRRHALRSRLSWLGYGTVSAGVWIAPAHLEQETREVLQRAGLEGYVDIFRSDYRGPRELADEVAQWWDLAELERLYAAFETSFAPTLADWRSRRRRDDEGQAFADYVQALTSWRRLPYLDPGLPADVLPRDWVGMRAAETFFAVKARLEDSADRFVQQVRTP